jgi:hypothetical protein
MQAVDSNFGWLIHLPWQFTSSRWGRDFGGLDSFAGRRSGSHDTFELTVERVIGLLEAKVIVEVNGSMSALSTRPR